MKKISVGSENAEFQIIQALKLNRAKRCQEGEIFIEGIEGGKQAQKAGLEITRIISPRFEGLSGWGRDFVAAHEGARLVEMGAALYRSLCDRTDPPELLVTARMRSVTLAGFRPSARPFILAFDRPSDFGNLGSTVRSANAFGADGVLIIGHGIDPWEPKVIRASLGSVFHTPVIHAESLEALADFINREKAKNGLRVAGTDSSGDTPLPDRTLRPPILLIIGNEATGMSRALKGLCDEVIRIPLNEGGAVNSLNAACAASILMWEVFRNSCGGQIREQPD